MKINYSDVCENSDVLNELKKMFPDLTGSHGYFYTTVKGIKFDVNIDRHKTSAGNQYIRIYKTYKKDVRINMGTDFDIDKILKKVEKLADAEIETQKNINNIQNYRQKVYDKFAEINKNDSLNLNLAWNKQIVVTGRYSKYSEFHLSNDSYIKEIKEIEEYFKSYQKEQKEIDCILQVLNKIEK